MKKTLMTALLGITLFVGIMMIDAREAKAAEMIQHTDEDYTVLPDKYNTGADESNLIFVTIDDAAALKAMFGGLPFKKASETQLGINFHGNKSLSGAIVIENIDFSNQAIVVYNSNLCLYDLKLIFINCKFSGFRSAEAIDNVSYEFRNCTIERIHGSNMDIYNCYIGGGQSDGIRAFNNVNVVNCYIADKSQVNGETSVGNHTDGTQIYGKTDGTCGNIHFENCRFELPKMIGSTASVNACLMLQIEFCDADDITFRNCAINGGGYSIYAYSKKNEYQLTNALFENIKVGCSREYGQIYSRKGEGVTFNNIVDTDSLYVGSVWYDVQGVHLSVTNDTNQVRTLYVCTDNGTQTFTIDACRLYKERVAGLSFSDYPFDLDIVVGDAQWVVCYDVTDGNYKQIRYENYTGENLFFDDGYVSTKTASIYDNFETIPERTGMTESYSDIYVPAENTIDYTSDYTCEYTESVVSKTKDDAVISNSLSGMCGNNITWTLSGDGTLILEGTGSTFNYHSGNIAPWNEYKSNIISIIVGEGITKLGNQIFRDCTALVSVELPSTLEAIGGIAFQKCTSLRNIVLPASLTSIGDRCFAGDTFDTVIYLGSDWSSVNVGGYNSSLTKAMFQ